ncbi:BolA family protein [Stappia sp.]|uniref:BolA family protein n=1 Tax=Stappia sp. TaxID=1870903 RepID=UPI0032D97275
MTIKSTIQTRLSEAFAPELLEVIDESEKHRGHAGWREGGETHFRVRIVAAAFDGQTRVARHRAVNAALAEAFDAGLHALAIEARAPGEADPRQRGRAAEPS